MSKNPLGSDDTFDLQQRILDFSTFWQEKVNGKSKINKSVFLERSTRITDNQLKKDDLFFSDAQSAICHKQTPPCKGPFFRHQGCRLKPWPNGLASWTLGSTCDSFWPDRACTCFDLRSRSSRLNIHTFFSVWPPDPDQDSGARSSSCYSNLLAKEMQGICLHDGYILAARE